MLYIGRFDTFFEDNVKKLVSTPDFKHVLYNTFIGLLDFFNYISNIVFIHDIPGSVQLQLFNKFNPFLHINLTYLTKNLQRFLVDNDSFQKNIQPSIVYLYTNFECFFILVLVSNKVAYVFVPLVNATTID